MNRIISFPEKNEYPAYAAMYMDYVKKDGSLLTQLMDCLESTNEFVNSLSEKELNFRYAPNKWSIKEILVHIIDDERIYGYRALAFARNDKTDLPGFEENEYTQYADIATRSVENIMNEYKAVRMATIALFNGFSDQALLRMGTANNNKTSVRALGYHILGHELHHIHIIKEKYLTLL
ncbi:DinB family protein [Aquimarina mytili]|uniref:DinB family protein n=1 Tax=Aquimarina mytili TaxID=874423 RepID=A0A936ZZS4_9FLAO|nr:DinB family protein [Aquimarina mytili]MBL0684166.1 DinB family protein [Aquimarina mytili]